MNQTSYNRIALQWAEARNQLFVSQLVIDFAQKLPLHANVLDVGCGTGFPLSNYLANQGIKVVGIDLAEQMIQLALNAQIPNTQFLVSDFFHFETTDVFDGILAWDSLWHFPKHLQENSYSKLSKLLKKGGLLLFTHGNADGEHIDSMMGEPFYYSALPVAKIEQLLHENGFEIDYCFEDFIENQTHRSLVLQARKC